MTSLVPSAIKADTLCFRLSTQSAAGRPDLWKTMRFVLHLNDSYHFVNCNALTRIRGLGDLLLLLLFFF